MANWLFDGVDLESIGGVALGPECEMQPAATRRFDTVAINGADGVFMPSARSTYAERQVNLTVNVTGDNETQTASRLQQVTNVLANTKNLRRLYGGQWTNADVICQEVSLVEHVNKAFHAKIIATYLIPRTFFKGDRVTVGLQVPNTTAGYNFKRTTVNAEAPIPNIYVTAQGPLNWLQIYDEHTKEWAEWRGTVATGQNLVIDYSVDMALVSGAPSRAGMSRSPDSLRVQPRPGGVVDLTIRRTGGTGSVTLTYEPHYF